MGAILKFHVHDRIYSVYLLRNSMVADLCCFAILLQNNDYICLFAVK